MNCREDTDNDFCPRCSSDVPSEGTYKRGEKVNFRWAKNNHDPSGFVKFSIVPYEDRCRGPLHKKMSFYYTCWGRGLYRCYGDECGTDSNGEAFSADVELPTVLPDGEYMVGWTWYGGGNLRKAGNMGHWSDYFSCTHITIKGGAMTKTYTPRWRPGDGAEYTDGCMSSVDKVGLCRVGEDCRDTEMKVMPPAEFKDGTTPDDMTLEMYGGDEAEVDSEDSPPEPPAPESPSASPAEEEAEEESYKGSSNDDDSDVDTDTSASDSTSGDTPSSEERKDPDEITGVFIVNADSDEVLSDNDLLENDENEITIDDKLPSVNLIADVESDDVDYVDFYVDGKLVQTERSAPYALASNSGRDYRPWKEAAEGGTFEVKISVKDRDDKELTSATFKVTFKVAES